MDRVGPELEAALTKIRASPPTCQLCNNANMLSHGGLQCHLKSCTHLENLTNIFAQVNKEDDVGRQGWTDSHSLRGRGCERVQTFEGTFGAVRFNHLTGEVGVDLTEDSPQWAGHDSVSTSSEPKWRRHAENGRYGWTNSASNEEFMEDDKTTWNMFSFKGIGTFWWNCNTERYFRVLEDGESGKDLPGTWTS